MNCSNFNNCSNLLKTTNHSLNNNNEIDEIIGFEEQKYINILRRITHE
mgnify:CR=1 FL=1